MPHTEVGCCCCAYEKRASERVCSASSFNKLVTSSSQAELFALKHQSRILGHSSNPVCGFSMMEKVRPFAVWPKENWIGSSLNQIQGCTTVRESYSCALDQGPLVPGREGGRERAIFLRRRRRRREIRVSRARGRFAQMEKLLPRPAAALRPTLRLLAALGRSRRWGASLRASSGRVTQPLCHRTATDWYFFSLSPFRPPFLPYLVPFPDDDNSRGGPMGHEGEIDAVCEFSTERWHKIWP